VLPAVSLWFAGVAAAALLVGSPPPPAYVAPCPSGVSGGLPPHYERQSLQLGPLALYRAGDYARYPSIYIAPVRPGGERYPGFESAATVAPDHTVTLAVAAEDRAHAGFLFDPAAWANAGRGYRVADGIPAITLRGCTAPYTQYQGGFVIDGPRRITLEAWVDGAAEPERRVVVFGA
jgi:hypothetical protein